MSEPPFRAEVIGSLLRPRVLKDTATAIAYRKAAAGDYQVVLEREIGQFSVVERDGLIIACAALYPVPDSDWGELACLAVHPDYRHGHRGDALLERIEDRARALGLKTLFVLTTRTAHWFQERGFKASGVERLPAARASLYNYQRQSKVFEKPLNP